MGPAAGREQRAVTAHELDCIRGDAELIRHHLPKTGLVPLPARLRSDDEIDAAFARHLERDALMRHAYRRFDVIGDADAEQSAALAPAASGKLPNPLASAC
jgi:hypothetical protein